MHRFSVAFKNHTSFENHITPVGASHWNIDSSLTRDSNFCWRNGFEFLQYFGECLVDVAADYTRLASAPNKIFENLNIEIVAKPNYVKLWLNAVEHIFKLSRCDFSLIFVAILSISQEYNKQLFNAFLNDRIL